MDDDLRYMPFSPMGCPGYLDLKIWAEDIHGLDFRVQGWLVVMLKAMSWAGGSVPVDDDLLIAVLSNYARGMTLREWRRHKSEIMPLLMIQDDRIIQKPERQYWVAEIPRISEPVPASVYIREAVQRLVAAHKQSTDE